MRFVFEHPDLGWTRLPVKHAFIVCRGGLGLPGCANRAIRVAWVYARVVNRKTVGIFNINAYEWKMDASARVVQDDVKRRFQRRIDSAAATAPDAGSRTLRVTGEDAKKILECLRGR